MISILLRVGEIADQQYCTEALCNTLAFACCCCSLWFWSYRFPLWHYAIMAVKDLTIDLSYKVFEGHNERERIFSWSHQFASGKKS